MAKPPRFEQLASAQLVGMSMQMTRANDQTPNLWRSFMPRRAEVAKRANDRFFSLQIYPQGPAQISDPNATFTKWAAVEVASIDSVPEGMSTLDLESGLYAVFEHLGPASDLSTVLYIFTEWLPGSGYILEDRPHFELLPPDYQAMDPNAREEFWIPVKKA